MPATSPRSEIRYPLNGLFGNQGSVRVLRELFRYGRELSVSALASRAMLSPYQTRLTLQELVAQGMVEELGSGKSKVYRVDRAHPLADAVARLFEAEEGRFQEIVHTLSAAANDDNAILGAWIYGSVARGQDALGSDLDVALVTAEADLARASESFRSRIEADAKRLSFRPSVVCVSVDDALRLQKGDPWWDELSRDAMPLKGSTPAAFIRRVQFQGSAP